MKNKYSYLILFLLLFWHFTLRAQTINWAARADAQHIANLNIGMEHGIIYGLGYSYPFSSKLFSHHLFPMAAGLEFSIPAGNTIFDDFKTKFGIQANLLHVHNLRFNAKVYGVFRRYQNSFAGLLDFGSDLSGTIGYYKPKWFVAGEAGFDKAIVTHYKPSVLYKEQYPDATDGWSKRATGGYLYYGLQAGFSFKKQDVYLKAGKLLLQDLHNAPTVPMYGQLGVNIKL
jgi:hypothetical protein